MLRFGISLLVLLALIAAFLLFPSRAGIIAVCVLAVGLGITIISILRRHHQQYRAGQVDRSAFVRNSMMEIMGILITLAVSIILARWALASLITRVQGLPGLILGMLSALLIGMFVSLLVQSTWGRLVPEPAAKAEVPQDGS